MNKEFVLLDCSPIKVAILAHCAEWQQRFHSLLLEMASRKLCDMYTFLEDSQKRWEHEHTSRLNRSSEMLIMRVELSNPPHREGYVCWFLGSTVLVYAC